MMREAERMGDEAPPLRVGAALPDPPLEFMTGAGPTGFDVALMQRIASQLGRTWQLVRYTGADFNGIFAGLDESTYDCVASGTTITPDRERLADFCPPVRAACQEARRQTTSLLTPRRGFIPDIHRWFPGIAVSYVM
jgi:ABC-type amino acid transport substrate-binding protein